MTPRRNCVSANDLADSIIDAINRRIRERSSSSEEDDELIGCSFVLRLVPILTLLSDFESWSNITVGWLALAYRLTGRSKWKNRVTNNKVDLTFQNMRVLPASSNKTDFWPLILDHFVFSNQSIQTLRDSNEILLPNQLAGGMVLSQGSLGGLSNMTRSDQSPKL